METVPGVYSSAYPPAYTPYALRYPQGYARSPQRLYALGAAGRAGAPVAGQPPAEQVPSGSRPPTGRRAAAEHRRPRKLRCEACGAKLRSGG